MKKFFEFKSFINLRCIFYFTLMRFSKFNPRTLFGVIKHEWMTQNARKGLFDVTPFTKNIVKGSVITGFVVGNYFVVSKPKMDPELTRVVYTSSVVGAVFGGVIGLGWTVIPFVVGVPYVSYKILEVGIQIKRAYNKN